MQQLKSIPSCSAYSTEATTQLSAKASVDVIPIGEGYRQVRRSAATIGLAISMGAVSFLLLNPKDAAIAAESVTSESTVTSLPSPQENDLKLSSLERASESSPLTYVKLAPLAIKHEVKQGESLWQLSKEYQVAPEAIAITNNLSSQANLLVGQTLKIPSQQDRKDALESREPSQNIASRSSSVSPQQLQESLNNLRETRKRLQESLATLKFEQTKLQSKSDFSASASVGSLSVDKNSTLLPQITALSPDRERLKSSNETKLDRPIAIAVGEEKSLSSPKVETTLPKENVSEIDPPSSLPIPYPETASLPQEFRHPELPALEMSLPEPEPALPTPKSEPAEAVEQVYQVKRGDTLNKIAHRHGVSISQLIQANNITNPNIISVAQELVIPNTNSVKPVTANPTAIAGVPVSSLPVITASAAPIPLGIAPQNTASEASKVSFSTKRTKLSVESPMGTSAQKLIADISRLQQEYPNRSRSISITETSEQANSVPSNWRTSETVNPEWSKNYSPSSARGESNSVGLRSNIQIQRATQSRVPGPRFVRTSNSPNSQKRTQLVGAAPVDSQEYNNMMRVPVGTTVGPELPPLSVPDEYLPDAPMKFTGYIWPAKGVLTSGYGWRWGRMHKGVDIAAPIGTPIMAAAAGEVISAGWNSGGYGNLVKLKHANGSITLYAHNSRVLVRTGQKVEQGELIAEMGSTGFSTGPHLHFEVHPGGQGAVNPMAYLPKKPS
jgi:murein DD-endopeptidase MepM/ murein hydrolase activator NlpD